MANGPPGPARRDTATQLDAITARWRTHARLLAATPPPPRGSRSICRDPLARPQARNLAQLNGGANAAEYAAPIFVLPAPRAGPSPMTRKVQLLFGERIAASVTL